MTAAFWTLWGLAWLWWLADLARHRRRRGLIRETDALRQAEIAERYARIEELLEEVQGGIANRERGLVPVHEHRSRRKISSRAAFAPMGNSRPERRPR